MKDGSPDILGATLTNEGVNFAVRSRAAPASTSVFTMLRARTKRAAEAPRKTGGGSWLVETASWRRGHALASVCTASCPREVIGSTTTSCWWILARDTSAGHGTRGLVTTPRIRGLKQPVDSAPYMPRCRVIDPAFDWNGDKQPAIPWRDTLIYELHVKGFTQLHPDVPPEWRGKYLALTVPAVIEHLKSLGVTAVELMPVHTSVDEGFLTKRPDQLRGTTLLGCAERAIRGRIRGRAQAGVKRSKEGSR